MPKRLFRSVLLAVAISMVAATQVYASTIGTIGGINSECSSCKGVTATLEVDYSSDFSTLAADAYLVSISIDTRNYWGGASYLEAVAVKIAPSVFSILLLSAPTELPQWTTVTGGLSAHDCSEAGSGFFCTKGIDGLGVELDPNSPQIFKWLVMVSTGTVYTGDELASVKALFVDSNGVKADAVLSENISSVATPEPTTAALTAGVLFLIVRRRRK